MRIRYTAQAKQDLQNIQTFLRHDSYANSITVLRKIIERIAILKQHPEFGRIVRKNKDLVLRQLLQYKYRIIYRIDGKDIIIITVHHSARLLDDNPGISQSFDE